MAAMADLSASLEPASPQDIAALIESLFLMYNHTGRTDADDAIRARAWLADMRDYPADVIESACVRWRRSDERFAPSPGQLIKLMDPIVSHRRALAERGRVMVAESGSVPTPRPAPQPVKHEVDPEIAKGLAELVAGCKPGGAA